MCPVSPVSPVNTSFFCCGLKRSRKCVPRSHENGQLQFWDNGQSQGETLALERKLKSKSFDSRNDAEIPRGHPENTEIQSWNSQYLQCPPMIVVARPNVDSDYKPLGLPVRSLRSRTAEPVGVKRTTRGGSSSGAGSVNSSVSSDSCKHVSFGELGSLNLKEKLNDTVSLPSPIPWSSRSRSMEERRDSTPASLKQLLHSRHLSVEESQLRHHKSRSVRSKSFASHANSVSSSSPSPQSSTRSATPDLPEVKMEDVREKKRDQRSSQSSVRASLDDGASMFFESNPQQCTNRVSLEKTTLKNSRCGKDSSESGIESAHAHEYPKDAQKFRNGLKYLSDEERHDILENKAQAHESHSQNHTGGSFACSNDHSNYGEGTLTSGQSRRREDRSNSSYGEGSVQGSSKLHVNLRDANVRASFRGKSVRTFRARGKATESTQQTNEGKTPGAVEQKHDHLGQSYPRKGEELGAFDDKLVFSNEDVERPNFVARPNTWNYPNHDEKKLQDRESMDSKEVEFLAKSAFDTGDDNDSISDAGTEANEVDKKAGEFIAKFREQIRLQKAASIDSSSVLDAAEDHYQ